MDVNTKKAGKNSFPRPPFFFARLARAKRGKEQTANPASAGYKTKISFNSLLTAQRFHCPNTKM